MTPRKPEDAERAPRRKAKARKRSVHEDHSIGFADPIEERPRSQWIVFKPEPPVKPSERRMYHVEMVGDAHGGIHASMIIRQVSPWWLRAWRWAARAVRRER